MTARFERTQPRHLRDVPWEIEHRVVGDLYVAWGLTAAMLLLIVLMVLE